MFTFSPKKIMSTALFSAVMLVSTSGFADVIEFIPSETVVANGDIVSYKGVCFEAKNNPSLWAVPTVNGTWNWTVVSCLTVVEDSIWLFSHRYEKGDEISYNETMYIARWANTDKEPGVSNAWVVVSSVDGWDVNVKYAQGSEVTFNSVTYVAKWSQKGKTPGVSGAWTAMTDGNLWSSSVKYAKGAEVTHDGQVYTANWSQTGKTPGVSGAWTKGQVINCNT